MGISQVDLNMKQPISCLCDFKLREILFDTVCKLFFRKKFTTVFKWAKWVKCSILLCTAIL